MKTDVMLGLLLGMIVGGIVVSHYKPAQQMIKKGTEMVKDEAKNLMDKVK